jgi:hypothetical protein
MLQMLALAALLTAAPAADSTGAPAAEASLAVQVASEWLSPERWEGLRAASAAQYVAFFRSQVEKAGGVVDDGLEAAVRTWLDEMIPFSKALDIQASLLRKHFTDVELAQLRDFYRSPLGKKVLERMPEIQKDSLGLWFQAQDMAKLREFLRPHIHRPSEPAAAPSPGSRK